MQQLKSDAHLQGGKYRIEKVLGQGGFGITYLATQDLLDRKVCIKEFFYKEYCERDEATSHVSLGTQSNHEIVERFLNKFLKEARTISQLEHPNIIKIHDIFKENNTAYYVMDYIEGESLSDIVNQGGALPEAEAMEYIEQIASALYFIHQRSINHLDVKPANVMVRQSDGKAILIDFGLSKQYDAQGGQTSTTPVGISHGYAPMEQYKQGGVSTFSPETDIYALGATLYKLVTGDTPPQAMDVMNDGFPELPASLSSSVAGAIKKAMQPRKVDRFQSVDKFLNELKTSAPASPFIQEKREENPHQIVDEETKVINNPDTKRIYEKKEERPQPSVTFIDKEEKKDNTPKIGCSIFLVLGCFVLFFVLRGCNGGNNSVDTVSVSQNVPQDKQQVNQTQEATSQNANQPQTTGYINGHEYVDLGLSVLWAEKNVSANKNSDTGNFFHWKDIQDLQENVVTKNWGNGWRLPTRKEFMELVENCDFTWVDNGQEKGFWVERNNNKIFLPAGGYKYENNFSNSYSASYWTSTLNKAYSNGAFVLSIYNNYSYDWEAYCASFMFPIRPVIDIQRVYNNNTDTTNDDIYQVVEEMPSYLGGTENLMQYLQNNVKYPREAQENNIEGRVIVEFIVEKDGTIKESKIRKSVDPSLDNEALRVIKNMPKWTPGKQRGKPVRVKYSLPIQFNLE